MSVMINVQPGAGTQVRVVQNDVEPPTLVIYDGTATLFFSPAAMVGGLDQAQKFAEGLVAGAAEWARRCSAAVDASRRADPFDVGAVLAEHGDPGTK